MMLLVWTLFAVVVVETFLVFALNVACAHMSSHIEVLKRGHHDLTLRIAALEKDYVPKPEDSYEVAPVEKYFAGESLYAGNYVCSEDGKSVRPCPQGSTPMVACEDIEKGGDCWYSPATGELRRK